MVKLTFEKLSRYERRDEPCTVAVPFQAGELVDASKFLIMDGENPIPTQNKVTAKWKDGSIKWLFVNFLANLPGNAGKSFCGEIGDRVSPVPDKPVIIKLDENQCVIESGELHIELNSSAKSGIFNRIKYGSACFENNEINGPVIYDENDKMWKAVVGENEWEVLEKGPIRAVVQTKGKHFDGSNNSWMDYVLRVYVFSGKPWIKLEYQIINCENSSEQIVKGIEISIKPSKSKMEDVETAIASSNYFSKIKQGVNGEKLYHIIDAKQLLMEANEHIPETFYGTFFANWQHKQESGICATIYQAHQNFPKALGVSRDELKIEILPQSEKGLRLIQGMAKTHRCFLHFHEGKESIEDLNIRSLQFQMPDRPVLEDAIYKRAKVFENVFIENKINEVERALIVKADARGKAYGILHWGDAPDPGYTQQGRGNGEPVWTNNEYDFPHAAMLMYARTGERRMLDYMLVSAEHWMDVDVCHFSEDPLRYQAQIIHSAHHATGEVEASHEWVEGLLDYYHQTGETVAYETAIGIGENILRQLSQPRYQKKGGINARETGWALRSLVALYNETYDEKWFSPAEKIVDHFEAWMEEYGGWLAPYTDHTVIRVPFMISIAVNSLMRFYRINPEERIKNMIISAVKDMVENCLMDNGLFYYKELPSLRRLGTNTLILEALVYAYEFTGDLKFLEVGMETFNIAVKEGPSQKGGKQNIGDAVIMQGAGPKGFAQSFYNIVSFYRAAQENGLLK